MRSARLASNGQALIELAIFGSFLVVVLGSMISFGLNADYRQQAAIMAQRGAMLDGARSMANNRPLSSTHSVYIERVIPDPSEPFAMGSVVPVSGHASSPARSFLAISPDENNVRELPHVVMELRNRRTPMQVPITISCPSSSAFRGGCTTAGFWDVNNIRGFNGDGTNANGWAEIDRLHQVYGKTNVRVRTNPDGSKRVRCPAAFCSAGQFVADVQIIDPLYGEIISLESAPPACLQLYDNAFCQKVCERTKIPEDDKLNCQQVCQPQVLAQPWYCNRSRGRANRFLSTRYEQLAATGGRTGLTEELTQTITKNVELDKQESPAGITTVETVNRWTEQMTRPLVYFHAPSRQMRRSFRTSWPKNDRNTNTPPKQWDTVW